MIQYFILTAGLENTNGDVGLEIYEVPWTGSVLTLNAEDLKKICTRLKLFPYVSYRALENQSHRIRAESTSRRPQPNDSLLLISGLWAEKPQIRISQGGCGPALHAPRPVLPLHSPVRSVE